MTVKAPFEMPEFFETLGTSGMSELNPFFLVA